MITTEGFEPNISSKDPLQQLYVRCLGCIVDNIDVFTNEKYIERIKKSHPSVDAAYKEISKEIFAKVEKADGYKKSMSEEKSRQVASRSNRQNNKKADARSKPIGEPKREYDAIMKSLRDIFIYTDQSDQPNYEYRQKICKSAAIILRDYHKMYQADLEARIKNYTAIDSLRATFNADRQTSYNRKSGASAELIYKCIMVVNSGAARSERDNSEYSDSYSDHSE
jgi:hypothetical protein